MLRAVLLSIVFSLAAGPDITLLCRAWCNAELAAATACHHETSFTMPIVAGDGSCDNVALTTAALREDIRRGDSNTHQALSVPRYQLAQLTMDVRSDQELWSQRTLVKRPLSTNLRI